jgi:hypothetical protein
MPTPDQILQGLAAIANGRMILAVFWHLILAVVIIAALAGWRPIKRSGATALAVPLFSVSLLAWLYGNPFNGTVFLLFGAALAAVGMRRPASRVEPPPAWALVIGPALVIFGWAYPHFLVGGSRLRYLYEAPTGLIPCPTLSVLVGLTLLAAGFSSRTFSLCLGILGVFYGLFGAFRLGVRIDLVLLAGAIGLVALALTSKPKATRG